MKKILLSIAAVALIVVCAAFIGQPQKTITSAYNQQLGGNALPLLGMAQDASTACEATSSDLGGSTDATDLLACANTGEIVTGGWDQATVSITYVLDSGSAVVMQCDTSNDRGATWAAVPTETSTGSKGIRTWTWTASASGEMPRNNFNINADRMRCRAWITSGGSSDTVSFSVRLASGVKR